MIHRIDLAGLEPAGLAIMPDGAAWVSTENDGVGDHSGETRFWSAGQL